MSDRDGAESTDSREDDAGEEQSGSTSTHAAGPVSSGPEDADDGSTTDATPADTAAGRSGGQPPTEHDQSESALGGVSSQSPDGTEPPVGTTSLDDPDDSLASPGQSIATEAVEVDPDEIDPSELTVPVRSLHPRVQIIWILRAAITATVIGVIVALVDAFIIGFGIEIAVATGIAIFVLGTVHALLSYRIWRYEVREDALYLRRGVLTRVRTVVPFVRIQHVDTSRSPVERLIGLSTSVVYTAGSRGADVSIPGLEADRAEDLQARLKRLAIAAEGDDAV